MLVSHGLPTMVGLGATARRASAYNIWRRSRPSLARDHSGISPGQSASKTGPGDYCSADCGLAVDIVSMVVGYGAVAFEVVDSYGVPQSRGTSSSSASFCWRRPRKRVRIDGLVLRKRSVSQRFQLLPSEAIAHGRIWVRAAKSCR